MATVHRLLATLAEWGAVERVAGHYRLGIRLAPRLERTGARVLKT
jgi:DNA-binding IclR family transcriptional regulator